MLVPYQNWYGLDVVSLPVHVCVLQEKQQQRKAIIISLFHLFLSISINIRTKLSCSIIKVT